jgi:hypothetical protein
MNTQFLDGVGAVDVSALINSGASAVSSVANLVSAAKGTGVQNLTQQPTTQTVVIPSNNSNNSAALLQQQLLLQQQAAKNNSTGLSTGTIIGIAVGGVAILGVIIAIAIKK